MNFSRPLLRFVTVGMFLVASLAAFALEPVHISKDGKHFVLKDSGKKFVPWGFNYLGEFGTVFEEYWADDFAAVEEDFRGMKALGVNVIRIHLQVGTYMESPTKLKDEELSRLRKLLDYSESIGLYVDITGLGCYHLKYLPKWFDELSEAERWEAQATFWRGIAKTCKGHPAVFCYNLMNEPVIGKPQEDDDHPWLGKPLDDFYFVQRICIKPGKRKREDIVEAWVSQMVGAIHSEDKETLVTVGVIPWANVWPNAKPVFYAPNVAQYFDFVSVHFYPSADTEKTVKAVQVYDIGKPIVIEETFPLSCTQAEFERFVDAANPHVAGWIAHHFGKTIKEHREGAEPFGDGVANFLEYWRDKGPEVKGE